MTFVDHVDGFGGDVEILFDVHRQVCISTTVAVSAEFARRDPDAEPVELVEDPAHAPARLSPRLGVAGVRPRAEPKMTITAPLWTPGPPALLGSPTARSWNL